MLDWTENELFGKCLRPADERWHLLRAGRGIGPARGVGSLSRCGWPPMLAALRVRHNEVVDRKVHEEIARAKARVLERANNPTTEPARQAEDRLVHHLDQPLAVLDSAPRAFDRLVEWNQALEEPMGRELWSNMRAVWPGWSRVSESICDDVVVD